LKPYWKTGCPKKPRERGYTVFNFTYLLIVTFILFSLVFLFSCESIPEDETGPIKKEGKEINEEEEEEAEEDENDKKEKEKEDKQELYQDYKKKLPEEIRDLPANELGEIMILMYHEIGEPEAEWVRTPDNFRRDLEVLYEEGYRLISMNDMLDGNIDVPPGTTPVVLTFDDGTEGQFRYQEDQDGELIKDEDGEPVLDPDCAMAILKDFHEEHPDFGLEGSFYIFYENPFRQRELVERKLNELVEWGFEVGNHAYSHRNLSRLSEEEVQKELGKHVKRTREYLPGYEVRSLALPFGAWPSPESLAVSGSYEGMEYQHEAILEVGWYPANSPFHQDFDPLSLPRVRASEMKVDGTGIHDRIEQYRNHPERRYISDGNPDTIAVPEDKKEQVKEDLPGDMEVVVSD